VAIALLEPGKRNRRGDGSVSVCIDFSAHRPLGRVRPRCRDGGLTRCPLAIAAVAGKEGHDAWHGERGRNPLETTTNHHLLTAGLAYPTYYRYLFPGPRH
jgi:hypothetical protein